MTRKCDVYIEFIFDFTYQNFTLCRGKTNCFSKYIREAEFPTNSRTIFYENINNIILSKLETERILKIIKVIIFKSQKTRFS